MAGRLDGIHALITGAAGGIGAACARRMAGEGAQLLLADLNGEAAKSLADELGQASVQADVTRAADIDRIFELAYRRWGRLDVLFNNAGIAEARRMLELTPEEWDRWQSTCAPFSSCCKPRPSACASRRRLPAPSCVEN
jgi:NAD(P)-dependent dehydrogenase (short-subunit alcohol dehydrogenase family)